MNMSTIVYQGVQSCLESQLLESRTLAFKLVSPRQHFTQSLEIALIKSCFLDSDSRKLTIDQNLNMAPLNPNSSSDWTCLQTLPSISQSEKESGSYVHPLNKSSPSSLSGKSLELCTENLGSETGTDIIENGIFSFPCLDAEDEKNSSIPRKENSKRSNQVSEGRKTGSSRNFPPPLTTMRGSDSIQVKPHREEGRLVIKAVKTPIRSSCFQAERSNGRLRLCLVDRDSDAEVSGDDQKDIIIQNNDNGYEFESEDDEGVFDSSEVTNDDNIDVGGKIGIGNIHRRPSMCKESGASGRRNKDGLLNLDGACWVATS